uniref:glutaminase n=1 Tax=uncultured marine group II/III euryarchaeote AD1000_66_E09 TaxID=1457798 RepID=A0A075G158_9EURY|nr:glutamine amidotransferase subunit (pdxT, pdx2) [uncultured marine group II/III euryarchaeote AD1000_66_E09]
MKTCEVRHPHHLNKIDGLVIPGGESTTISRLLIAYHLYKPIQKLGQSDFPIWGTCAGAILLANHSPTLDRPTLKLIPMTIERNGFGRQIDSFETNISAPRLGSDPYHAIFIRAPRIRSIDSNVKTIGTLNNEPVAVQYGALFATTFHPELTNDLRVHRFFVDQCVKTAVNLQNRKNLGSTH